MRPVAVALGLALLAAPMIAQADTTNAVSAFNIQYIRSVDRQLCPTAYISAIAISNASGNVTPAFAHASTRAFLDCARATRARGFAAAQTNRYALLAGASELLAADHESGRAALRSRTNAITLLSPLGGRFAPSFGVSYIDASRAYGDNAVIAAIEDFETFPESNPSPLATIANELILQTKAAEGSSVFS